MNRSSAASEKKPEGRSRSAWASMSGTEPRQPFTAFLPTAQRSRPNRPAAWRNESAAYELGDIC